MGSQKFFERSTTTKPPKASARSGGAAFPIDASTDVLFEITCEASPTRACNGRRQHRKSGAWQPVGPTIAYCYDRLQPNGAQALAA